MYKINTNYQKLPGSYLFSNIAKKVSAFTEAHPDADIIRLGIGDVTQPIAPAIIEAMHKAVDEMGNAATFHAMLRIWVMISCAVPLWRRTTSPKDAISPWTKSSSPTGQRVTPAIFRRFLPRIIASPYAIRYIRYMWTPM